MGTTLPFRCWEREPVFNTEPWSDSPRTPQHPPGTEMLRGEEGGLQLVWALGKMGVAGSCCGHLGPVGFGHSRIHASIQHGWFLEERIFVCVLTLVP